ncbi:MAG: AFG1 family ATPase [Pseudomonadales bacterium]|nr:AFG1 family ATPase [Pseudomonadales bacterium]
MTTHNNGPLAKYEASLESGELQPDKAQAKAVEHLQRLFDDLLAPVQRPGFIDRIFGTRSKRKGTDRKGTDNSVKGLYFWGGVGRGKTYLMDVFFDSLPFEDKRRMHFHRFMRHVHTQLKSLQGEPNPLTKIAEQFAAEVRVLCFDEFFVSDIADAMLLAGLLESMFANGLVLVATSNVKPENLYRNGLQRRKFLPAIEVINQYTRVLNVDGGVDYRLRLLESAEIYHQPLDAAADVSLSRSYQALATGESGENVELEIEGRMILARHCGEGVVWFDFVELCEGPRSQNDYIELAMIFQTVLISNVPRFTEQKEDAARRFISLVDEFYDHNVKLILSAEAPVLALYAGTRLTFEFQRTASRLQEMQSQEYLANEHLP